MEIDNLYTNTYQVAVSHGYFKPGHFEDLYENGTHRWSINLEPNHIHKLDVLARILQYRYPKKLTRSRVVTLIFNKVFDDLNITGVND